MNISKIKKPLLQKLGYVGLLSSLAFSSTAYAVDHVITFGVARDLMLQTGDAILVDAGANRSYTCEAVPLDIATDFDFSATVTGIGMDPEMLTARLGGAIVPGIGAEAGGREDNRVIFTPTKTDRYRIEVANANGTENVTIRCFATTLFGGFNTNVNDFNFLELTNIGNATANVKVTAITFDGTVALNNLDVAVPAGQRVDVSIHDTAGSDVYGVVRVTHDLPLGTLQATVSQYFGEVTDFRLGGSQALTPFTQNQ